MSAVSGYRTKGDGTFESIDYGEFLTIAKVGEPINPFRDGLSIKDNCEHSDFEERVYKHVNERLKALGYV